MSQIIRHLEGEGQLSFLKSSGEVKFYESSYHGVVEYLQDKLLGYLTPAHKDTPPLGQVAEQLAYIPAVSFPGIWPVQTVIELPPDMGEPSVSDTEVMVRSIHVGNIFYHPSLRRRDLGPEAVDGRMAAHKITRALWSKWMAGLQADWRFRDLFNRIEFTVEAGDRSNATGLHYYEPGTDQNSILWLRGTDVAFYL